jgi:TatD DNase family protein
MELVNNWRFYLNLIDSHCHFDFPEFDQQRGELWKKANQNGIEALIIPSVSPEHWCRARELTQHLKNLYWTAGLHPWWCEDYYRKESFSNLKNLLESAVSHSSCVALGETGMDSIKGGPMELQQESLQIHLQVAQDFSKPVILHTHKAQAEVYQLIKPFIGKVRGVVHAFSGSYEQAMQWTNAGFYLGVGGVITYERANKTREAIKKIPLDFILLETDAPSMPLAGEQGKINTPLHLISIAKCLAELKQESIEKIAEVTRQNTQKLFGLTYAV